MVPFQNCVRLLLKFWSYLPFLFCAIALQSIKLELPPFFNFGVTSLFYFARLHCNLINWSYLPFLFCAIALQSIKLELPPFLKFWSYLPFLFCTIALQSIKLELRPFFLILELPPFFILRDCIAIY